MKDERIIGKAESEEETKALNEAQLILDGVNLKLESTKPKPRD